MIVYGDLSRRISARAAICEVKNEIQNGLDLRSLLISAGELSQAIADWEFRDLLHTAS